jgi:myo-inositol 2-dehydrogenase / D-chiro-inositol 1-dehydrogenase
MVRMMAAEREMEQPPAWIAACRRAAYVVRRGPSGDPANVTGKRLRLAFVGCGSATTRLHVPAVRQVPEIDVVAFCDVDGDRSRAAARLVRHARYERDLDFILADRSIDAVAVCPPPREHLAPALAVLRADKHLFLEKPIALTAQDCDTLVDEGRAASTRAVVGFNLRQHRLLRAAREVVASGTLGKIELVRSVFTSDERLTRRAGGWRDERGAGGDVLLDLATHHLDIWRWLLHSEIESLTAVGDAGGFTSASVTARLRGGTVAMLHVGDRAVPANEIDIVGERARST